jgi:putative two-component system response regulator
VSIDSDKILALLSYVIHLDDPYGMEHGERVAKLSVRLARAAGLVEPDLREIRMAATIHDIGKIAVPESIRRRNGRLNLVERLAMEMHADFGASLLARIENGLINARIISYVRHHHENWMGNGYPDKLAYEKIPMGARIIRICDAFDAITHARDYKSEKPVSTAIEDMVKEQIDKTPYDPDLFRLFLELMRN